MADGMLRSVLRAARQRLRAGFFLDPLKPLPATMDASSVRAAVQAALRRLKPARHLVNRGEPVAGLVLYRDAGRLLLPVFRALLEHEGRPVPAGVERHAALLSSTESELIDALDPAEALSATEDLDRLIESALAVLDRPTEQQRSVQRFLRFSLLGVVVLLSIVAAIAWFRRLPNLALGRHVAASSVAFDTIPQRAIDGVRYGRLGFHSNGPGSEWWSVDLGRAYSLNRVEAYGRADCCFDQSVPLAFETSLDGNNYKEVASRTAFFSQSDPWVIPGHGLAARFIRFRTLRATHLVLAEVEVYGRPTASHSEGAKR